MGIGYKERWVWETYFGDAERCSDGVGCIVTLAFFGLFCFIGFLDVCPILHGENETDTRVKNSMTAGNNGDTRGQRRRNGMSRICEATN